MTSSSGHGLAQHNLQFQSKENYETIVIALNQDFQIAWWETGQCYTWRTIMLHHRDFSSQIAKKKQKKKHVVMKLGTNRCLYCKKLLGLRPLVVREKPNQPAGQQRARMSCCGDQFLRHVHGLFNRPLSFYKLNAWRRNNATFGLFSCGFKQWSVRQGNSNRTLDTFKWISFSYAACSYQNCTAKQVGLRSHSLFVKLTDTHNHALATLAALALKLSAQMLGQYFLSSAMRLHFI